MAQDETGEEEETEEETGRGGEGAEEGGTRAGTELEDEMFFRLTTLSDVKSGGGRFVLNRGDVELSRLRLQRLCHQHYVLSTS